MSLDNLRDNYFGCAETPIAIPHGFDMARIPTSSYALRLETPVAGTGNITPRLDGLLIDENTLATFSINGVQHNLVESILLIGGAHRLPNRTTPCAAELCLYFQHTRQFGVQVCVCIPIDTGVGSSNKYFETLGKGIQSSRPTLGTLLTEKSNFLCFRGADLRGRYANSSQNRSLCDPVKRITTHYLCLNSILISAPELIRLSSVSGKNRLGPPKPLSPLVNERIITLGTRIEGIKLVTKPAHFKESSVADGGIPTTAMKCYRLNPDKDIVGDKVYVGGKGQSLQSELNDGSVSEYHATISESSTIMPGDIQRWVGIIIGVTLGVIICSYIVIYVWSGTFRKYFEMQTLYTNPISASSITSKIPSFKLPSICPEK